MSTALATKPANCSDTKAAELFHPLLSYLQTLALHAANSALLVSFLAGCHQE